MRFEKVSLEQACVEYKNAFGEEPDKRLLKDILDRLELPTRATDRSIGYDFHCPFEIQMKKGTSVFFPLFITVRDMPKGVGLFIYNRSGLSMFQGVTIDNAVGLIDGDYYPRGIGCKLTSSKKDFHISEGSRVCQGTFQNVLFVENDRIVENERKGGFGSTGK